MRFGQLCGMNAIDFERRLQSFLDDMSKSKSKSKPIEDVVKPPLKVDRGLLAKVQAYGRDIRNLIMEDQDGK